MTDQELQGLAAQALNMAKRDIERGDFNFLFAAYLASGDPPMHRAQKIERLIVQTLGEDWLNHGEKKDIGFGILRTTIDLMPPDAVIIGSVINSFTATEKFKQLPPARQKDLINSGHDKHHEAVAAGLLTVCDAVSVVVQTATRVCQYLQIYEGRRRPVGKPEVRFGPQEKFGGRLKMYGEEKP
jgi:hypothetical protein